MRVLVTTSPGLGHMFPPVSLSWALRAAGHEVLFATAGTDDSEIRALSTAGLPVVELLSVAEIGEFYTSQLADPGGDGRSLDELVEWAKAMAMAAARGEGGLEYAARMFAPISEVVLDRLIEVALDWRPDLVLHTPLQGSGPLVAAKLGVPAVEQIFGLARIPEVAPALREAMAESYARYGLTGPPERIARLDTAPPSMATGEGGWWPMRYVPFNGGGVVPEWLRTRPDRPRVAVTLGSALPSQGLGQLDWVVGVAEEVDAEFVLAIPSGVDSTSLGDLPPNVRLAGYVPLTQLLATSAAVVHHGGSGSTMTALDLAVPQLVLPQGADQYVNAEAVRKRGCGIVPVGGVVNAVAIRSLLDDPGLHIAAIEVQAEMRAMPTPAAVVPRLVELVRSVARS